MWQGPAWQGRHDGARFGPARCGEFWRGMVRSGRRGVARISVVSCSEVRQGRFGAVCRGKVRYGSDGRGAGAVWQVWYGEAQPGMVWKIRYGQAEPGLVRRGMVRNGLAGKAWLGGA